MENRVFIRRIQTLEILRRAIHRTLCLTLAGKLTAALLLSLMLCATAAADDVDLTFSTGVQQVRDDAGYALAMQTDGKIIVGGTFKTVNGAVRRGISRFNADGSLDASFNANLQQNILFGTTYEVAVRNIKLQSDGKIIIAGEFTVTGGGVSRTNFARLDSDGTLDASFIQPSTNSTVFEIQSNGKIVLAVASGSNANGISSYAVRLNSDGTNDTNFPSASLLGTPLDIKLLPNDKIIIVGGRINQGVAYVARVGENGTLEARTDLNQGGGSARAVALQSDGKIIIGGEFTQANAVPQGRITRLNADFTTDITFNINGIGFDGTVRDVELTAAGKIMVGGDFTAFNGVTRKKVARLNSDGTLDANFNFDSENNRLVFKVLPVADNKTLVAGSFQSVSSSPSIPLPKIVLRLNEDGSRDAALDINLGRAGKVYSILPQTDGKILVGGEFELINDSVRLTLARLNADGSVDASFSPDNDYVRAGGAIFSIARQTDGKILLGRTVGGFNNRNAVVRLNADGSPDALFNLGNCGTCSSAGVYSIVVQPDDKIIIGGGFFTYNGVARSNVTRLNADGTLDATFGAGLNVNGEVQDMELQSDGKIIIAGSFTQINGTIRGRIARLNSDGTLDASFNPPFGANSTVFSIALQPDGKILLGGDFSNVNAVNRSRLARLNSDGSLDAAFAPSTNLRVESVTLQPDDKILLGGYFTTVNGTTQNRFARLNFDGSLDASFNTGSGADNIIYETAVQPDGKVLLGGEFLRVNNTAIAGLARLTNVPSAAAVTVSGRILSARGRGAAGAVIHLTDPSGSVRTARANSFGHYQFAGVPVGQSYLFNAFAKNQLFAPQLITINEAIEDLNFTAQNRQTDAFE